jgi:hypothetical protein
MTRNASGERLAAHIRHHRSEILTARGTQMQTDGSSRAVSSENWPDLLERIARAVETRDRSIQPTRGLANEHAVARVHAGHGLRELIRECCIEVRNHGEISPDVLPRLCEPFAGSTHGHGLGLGLYIVDLVVSAHGGTVRARSSNGVTSIQVLVPRRPVTRDAGAGRRI